MEDCSVLYSSFNKQAHNFIPQVIRTDEDQIRFLNLWRDFGRHQPTKADETSMISGVVDLLM